MMASGVRPGGRGGVMVRRLLTERQVESQSLVVDVSRNNDRSGTIDTPSNNRWQISSIIFVVFCRI